MKTRLHKKHAILATILLIFATAFFSASITNNVNKLSVTIPFNSAVFSLKTLILEGNDAVDQYRAGNGTEDGLSWGTAYRIENLTINANHSGSGIVIKHTNRYIIVKNVTVTNSGNSTDNFDSGVLLDNCTNIMVENCTFYSNHYGLVLKDSNGVKISDTFSGDNNTIGIFLFSSDENEISQNLVTNNSFHGIYLKNSDLNNISSNEIVDNSKIPIKIQLNNGSYDFATNNGSGLFVSDSHNNTIDNNDINFNPYGIYLKFSDFNSITDNDLADNLINCIKIYECLGNIINNNGVCEPYIVPIANVIPGYPIILVFAFGLPVIVFLIVKIKKSNEN
jgi:parallel beta-helix repeat protein